MLLGLWPVAIAEDSHEECGADCVAHVAALAEQETDSPRNSDGTKCPVCSLLADARVTETTRMVKSATVCYELIHITEWYCPQHGLIQSRTSVIQTFGHSYNHGFNYCTVCKLPL